MSEIKTPNWRLSTVAEVSTGHQYQITDRRTGMVLYFDQVRVWKGGMSKVKFKRFKGDRATRAGKIRDLNDLPEVIVDALVEISETDSFPSTDVVVSADNVDVEVTA